MEQAFNKVEELVTNAKEYVDVRIKRIKLQIAERTAKLLAGLIAGVVVLFFVFTFLGLGPPLLRTIIPSTPLIL